MSSSKFSNEYFKNWFEENFLPSGIVFSTKRAKKIFEKNNLTPSQFLRPFGVMNDYIINVKDYQIKLNSFRIDFFDSTDYHKNKNQISKYLNNCISSEKNIPKFSIDSIHLNKNNYSFLIENTKYYSKNYYNECEKIILEYSYFDENEFYQQPLLFIYFIEITDEIEDIKNMKNNFPNLVKDIYDTEMVDLFIILNDKSEEKKFNKDKINILKKEINSNNIYIFEINSNKNPNNNNFELFYQYFHRLEVYNGDFNKKILGQLISNDDINKIRKDLHPFLRNQFLEQLKQKVLNLENKPKNYYLLGLFSKSSVVKCEYFNSSYKFEGYLKAKIILGIIYLYFRAYKESYYYIKNVYKNIKEQPYKKNEISLFQLKSLIKFLIGDKNKIEENKEIISLYKQYSQLYNNSDDNQKVNIRTIRTLLINIREFESFSHNNVNLVIDLLNKYHQELQNFEYNFIYGLILEKVGYYYLYKKIPQIRMLARHLIRWCPSYWETSSQNNRKITYKYLLFILGLFCDIFHIKENYNESLKFSFYLVKKYILMYLISSCYNIEFFEGVNYFYLVLLKLYKIPENLNLNEKEMRKKQDEFSVLSNEISKFIISNKKYIIDNSDIINFDKSSILVITKREQDILDKKFNTNFLFKFKKYFTPRLNEVYCILTQNDLSSFKYIDKLSNNEKTFNYYIKKDIEVNVNETIIIRFIFSNPFPFDDKYESIKFIFDNEKLVECEEKSLSINSLSKISVELSVKFIGKGKVSIIGISYIRGYYKIRNIFDYQIKNFLYNQLHDEDKEYNFEIKNRKKKFSEYNVLNNKDKRKNYIFDILDSDSNINISIANNKSVITLYQYEVYYLPIKILNNSKYEIRKFSIFFETEDKQILLPRYFYNDEHNLRKEFTIYIPIICLNFGQKFLYIVFKFEEKNNDIDSKKFILELNVNKLYNIEIIDNYIGKQNDIIKRKIFIKCSTFENQEINTDLFKENNNIILPNNYKIEKEKIFFRKNSYNKEIEIHSDNINNNIHKNKLYENINYEEDYNNDFINEFFNSIQKNNLLYKSRINDINLLCVHEINNKNNLNEYQDYSFKHIIEQNVNITYYIKDFNDDEKYMTVNMSFDIKTFITFTENKLSKIKIGIDNENESIFEWIGLQNILINNFEKEIINKTFNCIIKYKLNEDFEREIEYELNKIYIEIQIEDSTIKYNYLYNSLIY